MRIKIILLSLILLSPVLSSCAPYKTDIRQGNFVTADMRDKLKLGMSRQQVRYVLGTPLVSDAFHGNRWDYVYRLEHGRKVVDKQRLTIYFEGDKLVRIDDDSKPVDAVPVSVAPETAAAPAIVVPMTATVPAIVAPEVAVPAAAPAVAEAPQPQTTKADPSADVWQTVHDWAAAWSAKDVRKYLAFYAPGFKSDGMSREDWEKQRANRISKPKVAKVELSNLAVSVLDDSHATATFTQTYRSDRYHDVTRKTMQLEKIGDAWLIVSEQTVK